MARAKKVQGSTGERDETHLYGRIAQKAHELWQQRGCCHGQDLDDWLEAERLVKAELGLQQERSTR